MKRSALFLMGLGLIGNKTMLADYIDVENDQLQISGPTILFFAQEGCPPCIAAKPKMQELAEEFPRATIAHIDFHKNPGLSSDYDINGTPTYFYVDEATGEKGERLSSADAVRQKLQQTQSSSLPSEIDTQTTTQEMPATTAPETIDSLWSKIVGFFSMILTKIGDIFRAIVEKIKALFSK